MFQRFIQNNFTIFATGSLTASIVAGWVSLSYIQDQQQPHQQPPAASILDDQSSRPRSREEYRLQAMVENALNSTWQQNLDNAFEAHERFMLPGRQQGTPKFVEKIDKRCDELMKKEEKRQARRIRRKQQQEQDPQRELELNGNDEEEQNQETTRFWK